MCKNYFYLLRGPLHRTGIVGRPLSNQKLARSLKSNEKAVSVGDPCELVDLSTNSPGWKNLAFIERWLRDHWEIDEILEHSLRDCFPW